MSKDKQPQLAEPELTTYDSDEIIVESAFTQIQGSGELSDRNLKENFETFDSKDILESPRIESFDEADLIIDGAFTDTGSPF